MPDNEQERLDAAEKRASELTEAEIRYAERDKKAADRLDEIARALAGVNQRMSDDLAKASRALYTRHWVEMNKIRGKEEAIKKLPTHYTAGGARNLIQKLIDNEAKKADEHLKRAHDLLGGAVAAADGAKIAAAAAEFMEAAKFMQEIQGKREIQNLF